MIRALLRDADPTADLPAPTGVADETPDDPDRTPETFLGWTKEHNYSGGTAYEAGRSEFSYPSDQPDDTFALDGGWALESQYASPTGSSSVRLAYTGSEVRVVLAGEGSVTARVDGAAPERFEVDGTPRSYSLRDGTAQSGVIELSVEPGVQVYSFTFG